MTTRRSTEARSSSAYGQGSCGISGSGVDADPRTRFMIDFNFNNLAAVSGLVQQRVRVSWLPISEAIWNSFWSRSRLPRRMPARYSRCSAPGGLIPPTTSRWGLRTVDGSYNHLLPGQEQWGAADNQFPTCWIPSTGRQTARRSIPTAPGPLRRCRLRPTTIPSNNPNSLVVRFEPAHDLQPARRPDAGQSGGDPDGAGARGRRRCAGRSSGSDGDLPDVQASLRRRISGAGGDAECQGGCRSTRRRRSQHAADAGRAGGLDALGRLPSLRTRSP